MSVLEEFYGTMSEREYQKRQERKRKRKAKVVKVLEDVMDDINDLKSEDLTFYDGVNKLGSSEYVCLEDVLEIINNKIKEVGGEA